MVTEGPVNSSQEQLVTQLIRHNGQLVTPVNSSQSTRRHELTLTITTTGTIQLQLQFKELYSLCDY